MTNSDKVDPEYDETWSSALNDSSFEKSQNFKRMHYVDIPEEYTRGDRPSLRIQFGSLNSNRFDVKRCYEEIQPRVVNHVYTRYLQKSFEVFKCALFNPVVIILFCLAAGVSIYVRALEMCLLLVAQGPYEMCEWNSNSLSMEHFATSLGQQMMEGVNSTIWNIDKSAKLYADELVNVYAEASTMMCGAVELAVNDTAQNFMELYDDRMKKLENETSLYHQALMDVESALSSSGLIPNNYTFSLHIPKLNASSVNRPTCQPFGRNQSAYASADKLISASVKTASKKMDGRPFLNTLGIRKNNGSCTAIYSDISAQAASEKQKFVAVYAVLGTTLLLALTIYWMWNRNQIHCHRLQTLVESSRKLAKPDGSNMSSKESLVTSYLAGFSHLARDRFFSAHMRVLFLISITLGISSATFNTIFTEMTRVVSASPEAKMTANGIEKLYEQYASTLNSYSFDTMRTLLGNVHGALSNLNRALISQYGFEMSAMTPFSKGVAYAHMDVPYNMKNATIAGNPSSQTIISEYQNMTLRSFRDFINYLWISSLVFGLAWILSCTVVALKKAFGHERGDEEQIIITSGEDTKRVDSLKVC